MKALDGFMERWSAGAAHFVICGAIIMTTMLLIPTAASAQTATVEELTRRVEQLAQRVDALEQENLELKAQLERRSDDPPPAALKPPAVASTSASPPTPAAPPSTNLARAMWNGPYLGANAGIARTRYQVQAPPLRIADAEGTVFGAQLGWRWQSGPFVTGLELELSLPQDQSGSFASSAIFDTSRTGRIKGQLGVGEGPFLVYATGGLQLSEVRLLDDPDAEGIHQSGFVYGAGFALRINRRFSAEVEAVQADLGLIPNVGAVSNRGRSLTLRLNHVLP